MAEMEDARDRVVKAQARLAAVPSNNTPSATFDGLTRSPAAPPLSTDDSAGGGGVGGASARAEASSIAHGNDALQLEDDRLLRTVPSVRTEPLSGLERCVSPHANDWRMGIDCCWMRLLWHLSWQRGESQRLFTARLTGMRGSSSTIPSSDATWS